MFGFIIVILFQVMELLVHVNKRLKSRPRIQLPMDDLFKQYLDPNVGGFVTVCIESLTAMSLSTTLAGFETLLKTVSDVSF